MIKGERGRLVVTEYYSAKLWEAVALEQPDTVWTRVLAWGTTEEACREHARRRHVVIVEADG